MQILLFEEFISVDQFRQNQHRYLQDDTIFIQIRVDFLDRTSSNFNRKTHGLFDFSLGLDFDAATMLNDILMEFMMIY